MTRSLRQIPPAIALLVAACAQPAWDESALAARNPEYADLPRHRLIDTRPYFLPAHGELALFLCRWTTEAPILVSLPLNASEEELEAMRAALRAWERAQLGVRFLETPPEEASIEILLEDGNVERPAGPAAGNALVDCRLAPGSLASSSAAELPAELVFARVRIARNSPEDVDGESRVISSDEITAVTFHELGHALGFQGHVGFGRSPMAVDPQEVIALGTKLQQGKPIAVPNLRALYSLPSGVVLRREAVDAWRTDLVDRMARLAEENGLDGPLLQVGDAKARIFWRDAEGREYGIQVADPSAVLHRRRKLLLLPEARTRAALPRSRDRRPDDVAPVSGR